jgi:hypothetical protein
MIEQPRRMYYILKGREPVEVTLDEWSRWFATNERHVADEAIGNFRISTVFLGINHNFSFSGDEDDRPPILFETMIFMVTEDQQTRERWPDWASTYQTRCATWSEAETMHQIAVALVKGKVSGEAIPGRRDLEMGLL